MYKFFWQELNWIQVRINISSDVKIKTTFLKDFPGLLWNQERINRSIKDGEFLKRFWPVHSIVSGKN